MDAVKFISSIRRMSLSSAMTNLDPNSQAQFTAVTPLGSKEHMALKATPEEEPFEPIRDKDEE
jgi:hypothetical protein